MDPQPEVSRWSWMGLVQLLPSGQITSHIAGGDCRQRQLQHKTRHHRQRQQERRPPHSIPDRSFNDRSMRFRLRSAGCTYNSSILSSSMEATASAERRQTYACENFGRWRPHLDPNLPQARSQRLAAAFRSASTCGGQRTGLQQKKSKQYPHYTQHITYDTVLNTQHAMHDARQTTYEDVTHDK